MAPTIFLVDFSEKANNCLCKLQYDNYLHLHYDMHVGERIEWFRMMVSYTQCFQGELKSSLKGVLQTIISITMIEGIALKLSLYL